MKEWPVERRQKLLVLIEKGRTLPQLASDLGVSYLAVSCYCHRHGLLPRLIKCRHGPKLAVSLVRWNGP